MTTQDFQKKSPLAIFLSYFKNHKKLFAIDIGCACDNSPVLRDHS